MGILLASIAVLLVLFCEAQGILGVDQHADRDMAMKLPPENGRVECRADSRSNPPWTMDKAGCINANGKTFES
jgi:hypothetical protein